MPSIAASTPDEIKANITAFFDQSVKPHSTPTQTGDLCGNIAMFDGIALETKCRFCPKRDQILGLCHEHSSNVNIKVDSMESVDKVWTALFDLKDEDTKVCFGSDATVVGIAPYGWVDHYSPVPIVASPSDKTEKGAALADWMKTMLDVWKKHDLGEKANGPIWALASDGDSTYRLAKHLICMAKELDESSPLGNLLSKLLGFNCWTSEDGVTPTCDPKHIFK